MREFLYEVRVLRNFKDSTLILKTITLMRVKIRHYCSGIFWLAMIEYYNFSEYYYKLFQFRVQFVGAWTFGPMEFKNNNIFLKAALTGEIESPWGLSTQSLNNASKQKASTETNQAQIQRAGRYDYRQSSGNERARLESSADIFEAKMRDPWEGWWILLNIWG